MVKKLGRSLAFAVFGAKATSPEICAEIKKTLFAQMAQTDNTRPISALEELDGAWHGSWRRGRVPSRYSVASPPRPRPLPTAEVNVGHVGHGRGWLADKMVAWCGE